MRQPFPYFATLIKKCSNLFSHKFEHLSYQLLQEDIYSFDLIRISTLCKTLVIKSLKPSG